MATFGERKKRRPEPTVAASGVYTCSQCGRPLELEMVLSAEADRLDGSATGYIAFQHFCPCQPSVVHCTRAWGSYPSFVALFGVQPPLPYTAPFAWRGVADDDPVLSRWRWELGQVADIGEFMLFLDDAVERRVA